MTNNQDLTDWARPLGVIITKAASAQQSLGQQSYSQQEARGGHVLGESLAKAALTVLTEYWKSQVQKNSDAHRHGDALASDIEASIIEAFKWSSQYQLYGMARPASIDEATVELTLADEPRTFRVGGPVSTYTETSLLSNHDHYLILGDPGSGKTTTIKRLIRRFLEAPQEAGDDFQYPVLIRLRNLQPNDTVTSAIADYIGVRYEKRIRDLNGRKTIECYVGGQKLEHIVNDFLNSTGGAVFLDGLDEVSFDRRHDVRSEIQSLGLGLGASKLIVSCRSGDEIARMEGFTVTELCPLTESQIERIAKLWLEDVTGFMSELRKVPYADVADRPLFIVQLVLLFKRVGHLPSQPSIVYEKVIRMMLQDWDAERGIHRGSKYADFTPDRKLAFLSALAYELTFSMGQKVFSELDLIRAYENIYESFALPQSEARQVAAEVQSHTGIVIASTQDKYEFSHLSLQEYLFAHYVVRAPSSDRMQIYITKNPVPLAVAVALSSDPSRWFARLVLDEKNLHRLASESTTRLLARLFLERPAFARCVPLGCAFLLLYHCAAFRLHMSWWNDPKGSNSRKVVEWLDRLVAWEPVRASIGVALSRYWITPSQSTAQFAWLSRRPDITTVDGDFEVPRTGAIPVGLLERLLATGEYSLVWKDQNEQVHPADHEMLTRIASQGAA